MQHAIREWWKALDHPVSFAANSLAVVAALVAFVWFLVSLHQGVNDGAREIGELSDQIGELNDKLDAEHDRADDRWRETIIAINARVDDTNTRVDSANERVDAIQLGYVSSLKGEVSD